MHEAEAAIATGMVYDYNRPLPILLSTNETASAAINALLEEVIKKGSFPIQRHKTSKWVDDSYILIGKARYYKQDFDDAIKTFKYVNTISPDLQTRQLALIWLMRSYLKGEEPENALAVSEFIKKNPLNKPNAAQYYLTRAQYYNLADDRARTSENLEYAVPLIDKKDDRNRARFVLAQLYQLAGEDKKAYAQYNKILKRNPPYELGFFTKLNLGQVTELSNPSDRKRIQKYYSKLLKDLKNVEYRDKIYYEMAKFELKQNNYNQALDNLALSARASTTNAAQKGYSYLLAGQIYYENLQNYRLAQAYYDSTTKTLPPTAPEFLAVSERRDILTDFTNQLNTIELQDSLVALARLDTAALNRRVARYVATQRRIMEEEEAKRQAALVAGNQGSARNAFLDPTATTAIPGQGGVWYFDNPTLVGQARADFAQKWGNRKLQDNWRRSSTLQSGSGTLADQTTETVDGATAEAAPAPDPAIAWRQAFLRDIPFEPAQMKKALDTVEVSLFKLGNIYTQRLKEPVKAAETFEDMLKRYPETRYAAEVYYNLYLLYTQLNDPRAATYAARLKQEFPKSTFARRIDEPNYLAQSAADNLKVRELYDSAYTLYENAKYKESHALTAAIQQQYPQNDINDKIAFLDLLLVGRNQKPADYKAAAGLFVQNYPGSPLVPRAQEIIMGIFLYESGQLNVSRAPAAPPVVKQPVAAPPPPVTNYTLNTASVHHFVILYPRGTKGLEQLQDRYSDYNSKYYNSDNLGMTPYLMGDSLELLVIKGFPDSRRAMLYGVKQKAPQAPLSKYRGVDFTTFVISSDNFPLFYKANNLEEYMAFYRKNYQK